MIEKMFDVKTCEDFISKFSTINSDKSINLLLKGNILIKKYNAHICDEDVMSICVCLNSNNCLDNIVCLELCYNQITNKGFMILVDNFLAKPHNVLRRLNLMFNNISEDGVSHLCSNPNFKLCSLRLNGNPIGVLGCKHLSKLLARNKTLELLDIAQSDQHPDSLAEIHWALNPSGGANNTLCVLDISRITVNSSWLNSDTSYYAEIIKLILEFNKSLREIHLQKLGLDGHDIEIIIEGLELNKTLLLFDVGCNNIGDHGAELLAEYLKGRPALLGINMSANQIRDSGARALSFCMPYSRIRLLDIGNNKITEAGILDVLNSIKKPVMLRILYMWGNTFSNNTNVVIKRMLISGVLLQEYIDVKIYKVDGLLHAAYYPSNTYKYNYYCANNYEYKNIIRGKPEDKRAKVDFEYYPHLPPLAIKQD